METLSDVAAEMLILSFLIITFLQSGLDKVFDWNNNRQWLERHFAKTFPERWVPLMLGVVTITEVLAGALCLTGLFQLVVYGNSRLAFYGAVTACIALLMLFLGQRMAKDYPGAQTLAVYFIPAVFLVFLLQDA